MREVLQKGGLSHEIHTARHLIIDHMMHGGDRITVYVDPRHPDDPAAYVGTRFTHDGQAIPLVVAAPTVGVDEYRRWNRHIEFTDSSYITIDVQRFEVWYHAEGRRELLIPAE